jgi:hypothetical protein
LQKLYRVFPQDWVAFASRLEFLKSYTWVFAQKNTSDSTF